MNSCSSRPKFLTLQEIAGWQIESAPAKSGEVMADLPALQRGSVWKVRQIEELWDSLLRGFPIGAFTVSPPEPALGRQNFKLQQEYTARDRVTHLLLDGQQRATTIALGFDDIWSRKDHEAKSALWLDISSAPAESEREFVFRVLTRAHPWGYSRTNPGDRLSSTAIRAALRNLQIVIGDVTKIRPAHFSLYEAWPWDAEAPVPVPLLVQAVVDHPEEPNSAISKLEKLMSPLLIFGALAELDSSEAELPTLSRKRLVDQKQAIEKLFEDGSSENARLRKIIIKFDKLLSSSPYLVPALVLDLTDQNGSEETTAKGTDAVELLFVRLNSSGTPLSGEELIYSLIKARWPDVARWMQELPRRPAAESRVAALCVRLVLARLQASNGHARSSMPTMPNMIEFRRNLRDQTFSSALKTFIDCDAKQLFNDAWQFLAMAEGDTSSKEFRLHPTQVVDMAQRSPDVFLLLLRWLDRLNEHGLSLNDVDSKLHRRTLGFLTAIAWFAPDKAKACTAVWKKLEEDCTDQRKLLQRFNRTRFKAACVMSKPGQLSMIPLPSPDVLRKVCYRFIRGGNHIQTRKQATIRFPQGKFWTDYNWWYDEFAPVLAEQVSEDWIDTLDPTSDSEPDESEEFTAEAAYKFLDSLHSGKNTVLIYAQRTTLQGWYPDFDPSLPEMMEDTNRPWDWDHILPESLIKKKREIPQSVKDWVNSIGNLRAWPLEANRSDGDQSPLAKLDCIPSDDDLYGFLKPQDLREASFINDEVDWPYWKKSVPLNLNNTIVDNTYLSNRHVGNEDWQVDYSANRMSAVTAIILRFLAIYEHWYTELKIAHLH